MDLLAETKMHPITLRFSGALENEFLDEYIKKLLRVSRLGLLLALFLYAFFGLLDTLIIPEVKEVAWLIRYAVVCPLIVGAILFTYLASPSRWLPIIINFIAIVASLGIITMIVLAKSSGGYLYYAGIILCIMFSHIICPRFIQSVIISSIIALIYLIATFSLMNLPSAYLINNTFFLISANLVASFGSYAVELSNRKGFIKSKIIESRTQELELKNQELIHKNAELNESKEELLRSVKRAEMIFSALSEALPGTVLDEKYRLDQKIGSGGFGTVYQGQHLLLQHPVAVKIFKPGTGTNPLKHLERFRLEGISACRIHHPNAVSVLDFGVSQNSIAYMVMELLDGPSLQEELLKRKRLAIARCANILMPVCAVLAEAHSRDIVHRDIKPSNIILHRANEGEVVKVVDFGIAKLMSDASNPDFQSLTDTGAFVGTPAYMSPERLSNKPYDGRSDVYSAGVMMYEMLCGVLPFQASADNYWSLVAMHLADKPTSPRQLNPQIPENLETIMLQTLEKDPQQRPTARELATLLAEFAGNKASQAASDVEWLPSTTPPTQEGSFDQTRSANANSLTFSGAETQPAGKATEQIAEEPQPQDSTAAELLNHTTQVKKEPSS